MQDAQDYASLENIGLFQVLRSYKEWCQDFFIYAKQWKEVIAV